MPIENLLEDIGEQAARHDDDDGEPGRATRQQLDKNEVHVLRVEERPMGRGDAHTPTHIKK